MIDAGVASPGFSSESPGPSLLLKSPARFIGGCTPLPLHTPRNVITLIGMNLSIVIPALDEERKISRDVQAAAEFIADHRLRGEVIVVDDGSSDRTATLAREVAIPSDVQRTVIRNNIHRGKGFAIRTGITASQAEYVMFADCGLTIPLENALKGLSLLQDGSCEIAHGSRKLPGSVIRKGQDLDRKVTSRLFHEGVVRWMHVPRHLSDTQCGFKLYRGDVARLLYAECLTEGFMFDIEIIIRAVNHGFRIAEFPVEWTCDRDSRISFRKSSRHILKEARLIRRTLFGPKSRLRT